MRVQTDKVVRLFLTPFFYAHSGLGPSENGVSDAPPFPLGSQYTFQMSGYHEPSVISTSATTPRAPDERAATGLLATI